MTDTPPIRTVAMERDLPWPAEKVWRALTQPHLLAEWLMRTDFAATLGHQFRFEGDWGGVDCTVLELDAPRSLAYSWDGMGLESTVTWTLTPTPTGTRLRLEQTGFKPDQDKAFFGAQYGWANFLGQLETLLAGDTATEVPA